ncbi:hypothetical protein B0J13DRAFT_546884 [Dactylonectria estremocensis]|uniref:Metalloprotease n=1 Tax=Dactylonectria estremocensis TaxID=1079267 RepID=A0A9P9F3Z1_9HYPO|nr:hypothetical protein B0J13DRAFT_546884 [Dactylonectria estremocensis]
MACRQFQCIVPPHLLRGIAESKVNPDHVRNAALTSLRAREQVTKLRAARMSALVASRGQRSGGEPSERSESSTQHQEIVSPYILRGIAESEDVDEGARARAKQDLQHVESLMSQRRAQAPLHSKEESDSKKDTPHRSIYDAKNSSNETELPGKLILSEGEDKVKDKAVNDAYDNVGTVLEFYKEHFKWNSIDNKNMDVKSTVHFGQNYENAFWDPERLQMVFGDGDDFLNNFTGCIDVIGHELTHAVTEHTSPLDYYGQPGALNEHVSDVFGIMVKQQVQDEKSDVADWLIGEDCILPGVKGVALRSMKAPGTAYDDPRFGKDPQPNHMKDYKVMVDDNGGVHVYSGIPNRAFYLASVAFGGYSWEKAGKIWWLAMKSGKIAPKSQFKHFADITVETAEEEFGEDSAKIVRQAWTDVGVTRGI